jgi:hypothetical protein
MPLDLSKLTDAVAKVAALAQSHADVTSTVSAVSAARDAAIADLVQAQKDVDALTSQLLSAAQSPAEAAGIVAVAAALAPEAPAVPAAPASVEELNAAIARVNTQPAV